MPFLPRNKALSLNVDLLGAQWSLIKPPKKYGFPGGCLEENCLNAFQELLDHLWGGVGVEISQQDDDITSAKKLSWKKNKTKLAPQK